jgi:hypothetical protein
MNIKALFILLLMALMVNISIGAVKKEAAKPSTDQVLIEKAKDAIRDKLKDPESAQFRNVQIGKEKWKPVRGEVNAKNSYGGYIGYDKFYVDLKSNKVVFEEATIRSINEAEEALKKGEENVLSRTDQDDTPKDGDSELTRLDKNASRARKEVVQLLNEIKSNFKLWFLDGW